MVFASTLQGEHFVQSNIIQNYSDLYKIAFSLIENIILERNILFDWNKNAVIG